MENQPGKNTQNKMETELIWGLASDCSCRGQTNGNRALGHIVFYCTCTTVTNTGTILATLQGSIYSRLKLRNSGSTFESRVTGLPVVAGVVGDSNNGGGGHGSGKTAIM